MTDLLTFLLFAVAMSITPGPNNVLVATGAANHGLRATVPHILGISLGLAAMVVLVGLGLAGPLSHAPEVHLVLRWVGAAWVIWIAWALARAPAKAGAGAGQAPSMGFGAAALFQWVNPKAWLMVVAAATTYTVPGGDLPRQVLVLAAIFAVVSLPCLALWAAIGAGAGRVLRTPGRMRAFNVAMALLLAASVVPVVVG